MTKNESKMGIFLELKDQGVIIPRYKKQLFAIVKEIEVTPHDIPNVIYELLTEVWGHQTAVSIIDKVRYKLYPISEEDDRNRRYILIIFLTGEEISLNGIQYHNNPLVEIQRHELPTLIDLVENRSNRTMRCDPPHIEFIKAYCKLCNLSPSN